MNCCYQLTLFATLGFTALAGTVRAQDATTDAGDEKRVQYQLVLPDEKTPESVKPEEHNPFESLSEAQSRLAPGDTEENRVRDKLLKLPVVGVKRMTDGRMRVLLGNIILETGGTVPPVLAEQLVELKVKNITSQYIELAWQEKRTTGLPPKLMIIPINISPKVRYQMLGQTAEDEKNGGANATMNLPLRDLLTTSPQSSPPAALPVEEPLPPRAELVSDAPVSNMPSPSLKVPSAPPAPMPSAPPAPAAPLPLTPEPATPPSSPAVESVVRMLFGNPTPAPK